jgi:hypothetical protein
VDTNRPLRWSIRTNSNPTQTNPQLNANIAYSGLEAGVSYEL